MPGLDGVETAYILRTQPPFTLDPVLRAPDRDSRAHDSGEKGGLSEWSDRQALSIRKVEKTDLKWMRWELVPGSGSGSGLGHGLAFQPVWGPFPFRKYRGPRSLL